MPHQASSGSTSHRKSHARSNDISPEHYIRLVLHRWWVVLGVFALVTGITAVVTSRMPNIYTSETTILVDPQKVPETYVKSTVTGDVRNRLGTLSQQILSATRLQKIIDSLNLYPSERKTMAREDIIAKMRADINVNLVSDGGSQDLEAFRITYSGRDPRLVAQVTSELASLFIEENLKVREQQATGTTEFLENQLSETRKALETQEAKLRDFKLKHIGEMPEQQTADLQVLGQLQSQSQLEAEALSRAEQQKSYIQSMMAQGTAPVVDMDQVNGDTSPSQAKAPSAVKSPLDSKKAQLAALLAKGYTDRHPDIVRLKSDIAAAEAQESKTAAAVPGPGDEQSTPAIVRKPVVASNYTNPVLQSQLKSVQDEIEKHKQELERLRKLLAGYQSRLEAIPVREQEIADLVRDYEISKAHYQQLLNNQLSAETATQLEIRQKGEKFSVLDAAQPAERPSRPNRLLLNSAGGAVGLILGILLTIVTEFMGASITSPEQITAGTGLPVLEVIPLIRTHADRATRKRRVRIAALSSGLATVVAASAILLFYRSQIF